MSDKPKHCIVGVHITDRLTHASEVQKVLTEYGVNIKTRLGLHEVTGEYSSLNGILILDMVGEEAKWHEMIEKLSKVKGIETKKMIFDHD